MSSPSLLPTRVLAVASHVVSGYVGNKIAVFALQALGLDVAALNTVQFSNHTGYRQWKGTKASAEEIRDLYEGLRQSYLNDFDMMLSGYIPGADGVRTVGDIAVELKKNSSHEPGKFFWVMDPVMGDNGKIYVSEDVLPVYKSLVKEADLIIPNQFEAELLSGVQITDTDSLATAIQALHDTYGVPHVLITSVRVSSPDHSGSNLAVAGSTRTKDGKARPFKILFPSIDCYFCGTGDLFAALITMRMREAAEAVPGLRQQAGWINPDSTDAISLPLAKAAEKVVASMHGVLTKTKDAMEAVRERTLAVMSPADREDTAKLHLVKTKAAELQLVSNLDVLHNPQTLFEAIPI